MQVSVSAIQSLQVVFLLCTPQPLRYSLSHQNKYFSPLVSEAIVNTLREFLSISEAKNHTWNSINVCWMGWMRWLPGWKTSTDKNKTKQNKETGSIKLEVMYFSTHLGFTRIQRKARDNFISCWRILLLKQYFLHLTPLLHWIFSTKSVFLLHSFPLARVRQ